MMITGFSPAVFAAGLDWLEGLLPLVFLLFWVVSQVVNVIRKASGAGGPQPPEPLRPRPPRLRPAADGDPAAAPGDARIDLERQIGEFLRQSRSGQPTAQRPPSPAPPKPRSTSRPARSPKPDAPPRRAATPLTPTPRDASTAQRSMGGTPQDGSDVGRHVHDAFAHDLRHLESPLAEHEHNIDGAAIRQPATAATELATAVRNPATLRQLILLHEVLDRPVDRW
ncbi:MAG: hypothetical protein ACR2IT_01160 [Pirellulales bacterium]